MPDTIIRTLELCLRSLEEASYILREQKEPIQLIRELKKFYENTLESRDLIGRAIDHMMRVCRKVEEVVMMRYIKEIKDSVRNLVSTILMGYEWYLVSQEEVKNKLQTLREYFDKDFRRVLEMLSEVIRLLGIPVEAGIPISVVIREIIEIIPSGLPPLPPPPRKKQFGVLNLTERPDEDIKPFLMSHRKGIIIFSEEFRNKIEDLLEKLERLHILTVKFNYEIKKDEPTRMQILTFSWLE